MLNSISYSYDAYNTHNSVKGLTYRQYYSVNNTSDYAEILRKQADEYDEYADVEMINDRLNIQSKLRVLYNLPNKIPLNEIALDCVPADYIYLGALGFSLNEQDIETTLAQLPKKEDGSYDIEKIDEARNYAINFIRSRNDEAEKRFDDYGVYRRELNNTSLTTLLFGPEVTALLNAFGVDTGLDIGFADSIEMIAMSFIDDESNPELTKLLKEILVTRRPSEIKEDIKKSNAQLNKLEQYDLNDPEQLEQFIVDYQAITGTSFCVESIDNYKTVVENNESYEDGICVEKEVFAFGYNNNYGDAVKTDLKYEISYNVMLKTVIPSILKRSKFPIALGIGLVMPAYVETIDTLTRDNTITTEYFSAKKCTSIALDDLLLRNLKVPAFKEFGKVLDNSKLNKTSAKFILKNAKILYNVAKNLLISDASELFEPSIAY